jgi:F subunit of K+-transporting ATPase (Potass_KdpF)
MKLTYPQAKETVIEIWSEWRRQKFPLYIFIAMCLNLVVAPVVYAATSEKFSHVQAWSLGLLGLGAVALSTYLFFVMFIPERF